MTNMDNMDIEEHHDRGPLQNASDNTDVVADVS